MNNKNELINMMSRQEKKCVGFGQDPLQDVITSFMVARNNRIKKYSITKMSADVIPLPDFSDLAEEHFFESLPSLYKAVTDMAFSILQADEKRFQQLSKINNMIRHNAEHSEETYMILQMGIRDAWSVHCQANITKTRIKVTSMKNIITYSHKALNYWKRHDKERALYYLGCAVKHLEDIILKKSGTDSLIAKQFSIMKPSPSHHKIFKHLGKLHHLHNKNRIAVDCKACKTKVIPGLLPVETCNKFSSIDAWISHFHNMFNSIKSKHPCICSGRLQHKYYYGQLHDAARLTSAFLVVFFKEAGVL